MGVETQPTASNVPRVIPIAVRIKRVDLKQAAPRIIDITFRAGMRYDRQFLRDCPVRPRTRRQLPGIVPIAPENVRVKWRWSANPQAAPISASEIEVRRSSSLACSIREARHHRNGRALLQQWLLLEGEPEVIIFCERPGHVLINGDRHLADFWVRYVEHEELVVLTEPL